MNLEWLCTVPRNAICSLCIRYVLDVQIAEGSLAQKSVIGILNTAIGGWYYQEFLCVQKGKVVGRWYECYLSLR